MTVHYALMSHGKMLGHTGALLPVSGLPPATSVWHFVPVGAFELVEPIIAELTAPPALALVDEVIPAPDAYRHPSTREHEAQLERLIPEAPRIHHFRLVLERYEDLDLELRDASGRRVVTTTLLVSKQLASADAPYAYAEAVATREAYWDDVPEPCYLLMARLASTSAEPAQLVASAA